MFLINKLGGDEEGRTAPESFKVELISNVKPKSLASEEGITVVEPSKEAN